MTKNAAARLFSTKFRKVSSSAIKLDCAQTVLPGGWCDTADNDIADPAFGVTFDDFNR